MDTNRNLDSPQAIWIMEGVGGTFDVGDVQMDTLHGVENEAFEFIEHLERLTTTDAVTEAFARLLGQFGFEFFCFNTLPHANQRFDDVTLAIRVPSEWLKLYLDEQYVQVSPSIRHCKHTVRPFNWIDAPYDSEREPRAKEFVQRAMDFGLANGIWVPIPGPSGTVGGVWMGGQALDLTVRSKSLLHLIALYAFDRVLRLRGRVPDATPRLTSREREVLAWVAKGKSAWEIGEILNIAKRTVDEHVHAAGQKLGAANRAHAVAIAVRDHLFEV